MSVGAPDRPESAQAAASLPFLEAAEAQARRAATEADARDREAAWARFAAVGVPTHRDEEWKYTSLRALSETEFALDSPAEPTADALAQIVGLTEGPRLVFWNGRFRPELSSGSLPDGVEFRPLAEGALPADFGQIASLEGKLGSTNDERFVWLNRAAFVDGASLAIAAGATVEEPIQVVFLSGGGSPILSFPRLFVSVGEGAQANIAEFHAGTGVYAGIGVAEIDVASRGVLEHTRVQDDSPSAFHLATLAVRQEADSNYTNSNVQFGARIGRLDANVWVGGEHAETWLNGAYVGRGAQHLDNHTRIDHAVPNCHSFEVYKGILGDRANGVFNGKIFVYAGAQKTDAKQTNQALLLSPTATVDTKPQLEIFADDVKCTHGATVGQLREDALFYLRSRGIPCAEARNLLVYAFVAEVLERIGIDPLREALEARLFAKLNQPEER